MSSQYTILCLFQSDVRPTRLNSTLPNPTTIVCHLRIQSHPIQSSSVHCCDEFALSSRWRRIITKNYFIWIRNNNTHDTNELPFILCCFLNSVSRHVSSGNGRIMDILCIIMRRILDQPTIDQNSFRFDILLDDFFDPHVCFFIEVKWHHNVSVKITSFWH